MEQKQQNIEDRKKKSETAKLLWSKAKPVQESQLGKKYLTKHRKISESIIDHLEFKFLRKGTQYQSWNVKDQEYEKKEFSNPAIIVPVENDKNEVMAIQRIFLNPNTGKKAGDKAKFTLGDLKGNAAIIHRGRIGADLLVIAEGTHR